MRGNWPAVRARPRPCDPAASPAAHSQPTASNRSSGSAGTGGSRGGVPCCSLPAPAAPEQAMAMPAQQHLTAPRRRSSRPSPDHPARVARDTRPGAEPARAIHHTIAHALRFHFFRRHALLHPSLQHGHHVEAAGAIAAGAMRHARHHEQTVGITDMLRTAGALRHGLVVLRAHARGDLRIAPAVVLQQLAAAAEIAGQIRIQRVDGVAILCFRARRIAFETGIAPATSRRRRTRCSGNDPRPCRMAHCPPRYSTPVRCREQPR